MPLSAGEPRRGPLDESGRWLMVLLPLSVAQLGPWASLLMPPTASTQRNLNAHGELRSETGTF